METNPVPEPNHPNIQNCLNLIEESQSYLNRAAMDLSPVNGFADEWSELGKLHDQVKQVWHQIDSRRSELKKSDS